MNMSYKLMRIDSEKKHKTKYFLNNNSEKKMSLKMVPKIFIFLYIYKFKFVRSQNLFKIIIKSIIFIINLKNDK